MLKKPDFIKIPLHKNDKGGNMKYIELHDTNGNEMLLVVSEIKRVLRRTNSVVVYGDVQTLISVKETYEEVRAKLLEQTGKE